ncbi:MAG TPA: Clp protease N-terminal domain-containing protein [Micromonosporaceae bacterium]
MVEADIYFVGALSNAYRRAAWLGLPVVNTDLVLCYAVGRSSLLNRQLPNIFGAYWRPVRRGESGLSDPDPPDTPRFTPAIDTEVAAQTAAVLRLAAYKGADPAHVRARYTRRPLRLPTFSPAVRYAVFTGLLEGERSGLTLAGPLHLIVGLLSVPDGAAGWIMKLLTDEDWEPGSARLLELTQIAHTAPGRPFDDLVGPLTVARVLPLTREPRFWSWPWRAAVWWFERRYFRGPYRRHGARYGHVILSTIETDALTKAILTGGDFVTGAHVLISVLDLHEQLTAAGRPLPDPVARWNAAGEILARHGVTRLAAARAARDLPEGPADHEGDLDELPSRGWRRIQNSLGAPRYGRTALAALRRASLAAHRQGHPYAGTTHLLIELLAEPAGPATCLLRHLHVDPEAVRADALRSLQEDSGRRTLD